MKTRIRFPIVLAAAAVLLAASLSFWPAAPGGLHANRSVNAALSALKPGAEVAEGDVEDFCRGKIAWHKIPKYVHFTTSYPLTASGKIQKYKLRETAAALWPDA